MINVRRFEKAHTFLQAIQPVSSFLCGHPRWLFRGQGSTAWGFTPSEQRPESWRQIVGHDVGRAEFDRIKRILDNTLKNALKMLGREVHLVSEDENRRAFAQHIGLPSPFLDFTKSANVAAYFAALSGWKEPEGAFVVYALKVNDDGELCEKDLRKVDMPTHGNRNIQAQHGVLVQIPVGWFCGLPGVTSPVQPVPTKLAAVEAFVLDVKHAPEVLNLLASQGVHAGTLFPGDDGVRDYVAQRTKMHFLSRSDDR